MFSGCESLTSIDLSNFKFDKAFRLENLFSSCSSLSYIDLSSLYVKKSGIFNNLSQQGKIKINKNAESELKSYVKNVLKDWEIIID